MSFASDISKYAKKTKLSMDDAIVAINSEVASNIIYLTPVDSGRARGNWYPTIGTVSTKIDLDKKDKTGKETADKAEKIAEKSAGQVFFLANNLKYIHRLEYDSWSKQASRGFLRVSIQEMETTLKKFKGN